MTRDNYHIIPLDQKERGTTAGADEKRKSCPLPLGKIKSFFGSISRGWSYESNKHSTNPEAPQKKYVHTPTHAASSHLRTMSNASMKKANEVL